MGDAAQNLEPQSALDVFKQYEHFAKVMLDGFCVVDMAGKVLKCNPLFSQLVGFRTRHILRNTESLDEMLELRLSDRDLPVRDIIDTPTPTRLDEVAGKSKDHDNLNLIIGIYPLIAGDQQLGAFILVRDVTAETNLQDKYKDKATQSITDALTGLYNRAYFVDFMASTMANLEILPKDASQRVLSIVMLDIDFFKRINDDFGHQAGDYVLQHVSQVMKDTFRKTDVVCRYGGEEFLAILPGTEAKGSLVAAEKLRQAIEGYHFEYEGRKIPVTISSGVAQVNVGKENGEQTIARADAALYFSKENGRNQVSLHDGDGTKPFTLAEGGPPVPAK